MNLTRELKKEIEFLKKENDIIILAHTYQIAEIQDIADYVGDSLGLALKVKNLKQKNIIFCGVKFMAETAKVVAPEKNIILPVENALCPMAAMAKANELREFKKSNPSYKIVSYVNSTLETKAESYACCTSSNAVKVVASLKNDDILFAPDYNLGSYVKKILKKENMQIWNGHCSVHNKITVKDVQDLKAKHKNAEILAHPECRSEILELANFIGSTGAIIDFVKTSKFKEFIILTEEGIKHQLEKYRNDASFYFVPNTICVNMKKITLSSVYNALKNLEPKILVETELANRARQAIDNMIRLS